MSKGKTIRPLAYILLMIALPAVLVALVALVANSRGMNVQPLIGLMGLPLGLGIGLVILMRRSNMMPIPERLMELRAALAASGHPDIRFQYFSADDIRGKIPQLHSSIPSFLTISDLILKELSPRALLWLARSALHRGASRAITIFLVVVLFTAVIQLAMDGLALAHSLTLLLLALVITLIALGAMDLAFSQAADRAVTNSHEDRLAAKEALSFLYYTPLGCAAVLSPLQRLRSRARANAVGILLERGFRSELQDL